MGRRPRRKAEETREDILSVAELLFRERGYVAVSIADIAAALGMSPANVFKHFHSKVALVDAIAERHLSRTAERFAAFDKDMPPQEQLLAFVLRLLDSHLEDLRNNPYLFEMVLTTMQAKLEAGRCYRERITEKLAGIITQGIADGTYHCGGFSGFRENRDRRSGLCSSPCHHHAGRQGDINVTRARDRKFYPLRIAK